MRTRTIAAATAALLLASCATSHVPRRKDQVAVVMTGGGEMALHRDGVFYPLGVFGGQAVDAVQGVPAAEDAARTYGTERASSFVASLASAGLLVGSVVVWNGGFENDSDRTLALGLVIGSLTLSLVSGFLQLEAQAHLLDAVNLYNDARALPDR